MTDSLTLPVSNGIVFSKTGMQASRFSNYHEWFEAGLALRRFEDEAKTAFAFCWGDWLLYGEEHLGDSYTQAIELPNKAQSTLNNYRWGAKNTPGYLREIPHLHFRHYLDSIKVENPDERWQALLWASINRLSVSALNDLIDAHCRSVSERPQELPPPANPDDTRFLLEQENYELQRRLGEQQAALDETGENISRARDILEDVAGELPDEQAGRIEQALAYLRPVVVSSEFVDLACRAIDLYEEGRFSEMVDIMSRLGELRAELFGAREADSVSARAETLSAFRAETASASDLILRVNGRVIDMVTGEILDE